ncbi:hypothetical protein CO540_13165 [Micromonospora sp. WMMA2032]|uniref:hypothetical protein n=1 Tax=Micromonospora sp. WMMA2032 TaxID=2039870 RepID=UPI000C058D8C|nr:hypothetical protein [Micromonospora sp. WMMA2032]ATO14660.1 hypothetical protein CO540_13165 [Micromonospora sp. WMMA2032]
MTVDLADVLAHTGWTRPVPTTWPATAEGPNDPPVVTGPWFPRHNDDFPTRADPALNGHDPGAIPVTAADAGLADDPIAVVLELRARLEAAIDQLTPQQRSELAQYRLPEVA